MVDVIIENKLYKVSVDPVEINAADSRENAHGKGLVGVDANGNSNMPLIGEAENRRINTQVSTWIAEM